MAETIVHRTALDVAAAKTEGLSPLPFEKGLFVTNANQALWESPAIEAEKPFDDLVGSWNAEVPKGAKLEMQAMVRAGGRWSRWFSLGRVEGNYFFSAETQENAFGHVDIDTLKLKAAADAFRYRFLMSAGGRSIAIKLAAITLSDGQAPAEPAPFQNGPWARELKIAPRSQTEAPDRYKHDICSPVSLGMALEYWGRPVDTLELADKVRDQRDPEDGRFGVWPANVAIAAAYGLEAYVARLDSLSDLEREIAAGRPVVASITYGAGELEDSPIAKTRGHLLLVAGFTEQGDVIAFDPAAPRASARRVYKRTQFHKAWRVKKRGLSYLIGPLGGRSFRVGISAADLRAKPSQKKKGEASDPERLSQLLYGETVTVLSARGDWAQALADQQPEFLISQKWQGYSGWLKAEALISSEAPRPNVVVRTRQALAQRDQDFLVLSVGTRLRRISEDKGVSLVRLLDGGTAEISSDSLFPIPDKTTEASRAQIVKTAELFLGTSYYWGGTSGVQPHLSIGVDCSGLALLAYRVHGMDLPRNSHEQKLRSRSIKRADLKPGDLVFLSESEKGQKITHVMIYTGGDGVIESRETSGRVLRSSFKERFGKTLSEIESGDVVMDHSLPKPRTRMIYFGSYL
ncbi:MAG: C39 family peptidase [Elusimicrobia bacterium]|nr:C39 family peptidase [Elusimicrobiota bacterium]